MELAFSIKKIEPFRNEETMNKKIVKCCLSKFKNHFPTKGFTSLLSTDLSLQQTRLVFINRRLQKNICAKKTQPKTQPGLAISFQTKLCDCFSDFLGLTKSLRLEETLDWSKLLKFGRTCSNTQGAIGMNTKKRESTIFKAEAE